jgi:phage repressor protein C with HTH and peptisase S24 domain
MNQLSTSFGVPRMVHFGDMSLKLVRIARLKQFQAEKQAGGAVELGRLIGKSVQQTSDLLSGRASFGEKVARSIEDFAALPPGWLDEEDETGIKVLAAPAVKRGGEMVIQQYREKGGAMGQGVLLRDQPGAIQSWHVTPEWIQKNVPNCTSPRNLAIVTGFGDSMRPLYNPGDPLLVDTGVKVVEFDAIYFFRIGEEGFIKRLQRVPGEGLVAISENKAYKEWIIKDNMEFEVFARVVKVWRGEEF